MIWMILLVFLFYFQIEFMGLIYVKVEKYDDVFYGVCCFLDRLFLNKF